MVQVVYPFILKMYKRIDLRLIMLLWSLQMAKRLQQIAKSEGLQVDDVSSQYCLQIFASHIDCKKLQFYLLCLCCSWHYKSAASCAVKLKLP